MLPAQVADRESKHRDQPTISMSRCPIMSLKPTGFKEAGSPVADARPSQLWNGLTMGHTLQDLAIDPGKPMKIPIAYRTCLEPLVGQSDASRLLSSPWPRFRSFGFPAKPGVYNRRTSTVACRPAPPTCVVEPSPSPYVLDHIPPCPRHACPATTISCGLGGRCDCWPRTNPRQHLESSPVDADCRRLEVPMLRVLRRPSKTN